MKRGIRKFGGRSSKKDVENVWYYIQGTVRMFLYNYLPFMIRPHIKDQFEKRKEAAKLCFINGSCLSCGCKTPDLFMANKACSLLAMSKENRQRVAGRTDYCYDFMLTKKQWLTKKQKEK